MRSASVQCEASVSAVWLLLWVVAVWLVLWGCCAVGLLLWGWSSVAVAVWLELCGCCCGVGAVGLELCGVGAVGLELCGWSTSNCSDLTVHSDKIPPTCIRPNGQSWGDSTAPALQSFTMMSFGHLTVTACCSTWHTQTVSNAVHAVWAKRRVQCEQHGSRRAVWSGPDRIERCSH